MATNREQSHEQGVVFLVLLALIVVGIAVAAFIFVANAQSKDAAAQGVSRAIRFLSS